jgi:hypothetical protein
LPAWAGYSGQAIQETLTEIMFRLLLRFLGLCLLAFAFVSLIVDAMRTVTGGTFFVTSIGESLMALLPGKFVLARDFIERQVPPVIWDPVLIDLLRLPVWLAFGVIGGMTIWLGSNPAPKFGISSR